MAESNAVEALDNFFEDWVPDMEYNVMTAPAYETPAVPERPARRGEPRRREQEARERRVRIRTLPSQNPAPRERKDRGKVLFLLSAAILLIGALSIVASYSDIYARKAEISALKEEIDQTKLATAAGVIQTDPIQDMNELYTYAVNDLGMEEADGSNTVFITLPRQSYTEMPQTAQEQTSKVTFHWFSTK